MYDLPYHKATNEREIHEFIREHPFAFVTGCDAQGRPVVTQLPVLFEERDGRQFLSGHLMKNTDHHKAFQASPDVLVVFSSPHVYVSGSWYSDPHTPSTWNYMSVHARGVLRFLGESDLLRILKQTSLHFEGYEEGSPTAFDNLPTSMTARLVKMIVAFEIEVASIDSVFKLSQDRDAESYQRIIEKLRQNGDAGRFIAAEMERRRGALFPKERKE